MENVACMRELCRWTVVMQRASPARQRFAGGSTHTCAGHLPVGLRPQSITFMDAHTSAGPAVCVLRS